MRPAISTAALCCLGTLALYHSEAGRSLELATSRRIEFVARHALGKGPRLAPKLKVFWYDDLAAADNGSVQLTLSDWASLIEGVQKANPRLIVIDQTFSYVSPGDAGLERLRGALRHGTPVATLAFGTPREIPERARLLPDREELQASAYASGLRSDPAAFLDTLAWLPQQIQIPYGPSPLLAPAISRVGQAVLGRRATMVPFVRIGPGQVLPNIGLYGAGTLSLTHQGPMLDGHAVPLDRFGDLIPNLIGPFDYKPLRTSMRGLIRAAQDGVPVRGIESGDYVLLLPSMYTGGLDVKSSPLGDIPGGLIVASILNSALTGQWLTPVPYADALILLAALLGGFVFTAFTARLGGLILALLVAADVAFGMLGFIFQSYVIPWDFAAIALLTSGFFALFQRTRREEFRGVWLRSTLQGVVAPKRLEEILANPTSLTLEPSEQIVTIMFIDIAGFSTTADRQSPKEAFLSLRDIIGRITALVHTHGGIVDRTLGDGLLCYFGYDYSGEPSLGNHAAAAVRCAQEIQRENVRRSIADSEGDKPIYPLRIGINTAGVYLGDLGDERRIDFTLIGRGVNFAQRLEACCEQNMILVSEKTRALASDGADIRTERKLIKVKHHSDLFEAFEVNPLPDEPALLEEAMAVYWRFHRIDRKEPRWDIDPDCPLVIATVFGRGELVDASDHGLGIVLPTYLGRGIMLDIEIESRGSPASSELVPMRHVKAEVRWSKPTEQGYLHGMRLADSDGARLEGLLRTLGSGERMKIKTGAR